MSEEANVPNSGNLEADLEAVELEVLPDVTSDVTRDRKAVVKAFMTLRADRLELGLAINSYRLHFKPRRSWLRIAEVLGRELGRSQSTLYNLMHDAERALKLTKIRRSALRAEGVEPATPRYAPILSRLAGGSDDETPADARLAVRAAIAEFKSYKASRLEKGKKVPTTLTLDEFADQEIAKLAQFSHLHEELTRQAIADAMTQRIQVWATTSGDAEKPDGRIDVSRPVEERFANAGSTSCEGNHTCADGHDAGGPESAQSAEMKRPPAPAVLQQPTLFDNVGGEIA